jgi:hypothetical protein
MAMAADSTTDLGRAMAQMADVQARLTGAKLFEEVMTPAEKYAERINMLEDALRRGAISSDTFGRQVIKANQEILKLNQAISPVQAAKWPSAEAFTRLNNYRQTLQNTLPIIQAAALTEGREGLAAARERQPAGPVELPTFPVGGAGITAALGIGAAGQAGAVAGEAPTFTPPSGGLGGMAGLIAGATGQAGAVAGGTEASWSMTMAASAQGFSNQVNLAGEAFYNWINRVNQTGGGFVGPPRPELEDLTPAEIQDRFFGSGLFRGAQGQRPEDIVPWLPSGGGEGGGEATPIASGLLQQILTAIQQAATQAASRPVVEMQSAGLEG